MINIQSITGDNVVTVTRVKEDRYIIESLLFNEPSGVGIQGIIRNVEFFTTGAEFSEPLILSKSRVAGRLKKLENLGFVYHKSTANQYLWFIGETHSVLKPTHVPENPVHIKPAKEFENLLTNLVDLNSDLLDNKLAVDTNGNTHAIVTENVEVDAEVVIEGITITENDVLPFNNTIVTKVIAPKTPEQLALQQSIIAAKFKEEMEIVSKAKDTSVFYFIRYKLTRADGQVAHDSKCMSMPQQITSNKDLETLKDLIIKSVKANQKVCKVDIIYLSKT